ncbi:uncharacterized protein TEOVI_000776000 [Trypanosoma equiperdum]|uniref:Uncharacterized protein n=2 Tax=Trypanozoon TaxID=39700 RepID=Q584Y1_TRYB2|nr:hypothetical protein, conserved [Trypanosoma brucei brucei TREU927]AAX79941.1 hypothetical protein, conserved [Trypanosoma brucei]AAZ11900.1 hypothetical protein, conserved [Trypanosoma brucei brucei TREU927]SCU65834.1 hypothetical protein, conserved [Trypanosoma equiperdum]
MTLKNKRPGTAPLVKVGKAAESARPSSRRFAHAKQVRRNVELSEDEEELRYLEELLGKLLEEKALLGDQIASMATDVLDYGEVVKLELRLEAARSQRKEAIIKINGMGACFNTGKGTVGKKSPTEALQRREYLEVKHSIHSLSMEVGQLRLKLETLKNEIKECDAYDSVVQEENEGLSSQAAHADAERELKRLINEKHRIIRRVEEANAAHLAAIRQEAKVARDLGLLEKRTRKFSQLYKPEAEVSDVCPKIEEAQFLHSATDLADWGKFSHANCGPCFCLPVRIAQADTPPKRAACPAPTTARRDTPPHG